MKVNVFFIRNLFSIKSSEAIIKKRKLKNTIAVFTYTEGAANVQYISKLKEGLNMENWTKIKIFKHEFPSFNKNMSLFYYKKVKVYYQNAEFFLKDLNLKEVYITNPNAYSEKVFYEILKKRCQNINLYEEGINMYYDYAQNSSVLKKNIRKLFLFDFLKLEKKLKDYEFNEIFSTIPEKVYLKKYNKLTELPLKEMFLSEKESKIKNNNKILFISRPISEEGYITLEEEFSLVKKIVEKYGNKNIIFKFHPRESEKKQEEIKSEFNVITVKESLKKLSAEEIILKENYKKIIGYDSSTLVYMSEIKDIEVISLVSYLKEKNLYLNLMYNLFKMKFRNIDLIEGRL